MVILGLALVLLFYLGLNINTNTKRQHQDQHQHQHQHQPQNRHPLPQVVLYTAPVRGDVPLAYLITFRSYGTWLHGDERGSVDRWHNYFGTPCFPANDARQQQNARRLKHAPITLNAEQRKSVEYAILETCLFRNWNLHAVNVRTNHAHSLITAYAAPSGMSVPFAAENGFAEGIRPERILNALKANATRQLRQDGHWPYQHTPWADGGSRKYVWTEFQLERAKDYVISGQGGPIPEFPKRKS